MTIEIVDFPIENGWIFPVRYVNYVNLPEGIMKTTNIQSPKEKLLEHFAVLTNQNRT